MKNVQSEYSRCTKCGGKVFFDRDHYGWYAQCLLCGCLRNLEELPVTVGQVDRWAASRPEKEKEAIRR